MASPTRRHPELLMWLEKLVPGIAHHFATPMGGQVLLPMRLYLYGSDSPDVLARDESSWRE